MLGRFWGISGRRRVLFPFSKGFPLFDWALASCFKEPAGRFKGGLEGLVTEGEVGERAEAFS